jgi:hypothetical protein
MRLTAATAKVKRRRTLPPPWVRVFPSPATLWTRYEQKIPSMHLRARRMRSDSRPNDGSARRNRLLTAIA